MIDSKLGRQFLLGLVVSAILFVVINKKGAAETIGNSETNPHAMKRGEYAQICKMCHLDNPFEADGQVPLSGSLTEVCYSCHRKVPFSCRKAVTLTVTTILQEQMPNLILNTRNGILACDSCHLVHGEREKAVKPVYSLFLKNAEDINPHRAVIFCIFCHDKEPQNGNDPLNLKYGGDRVLVCTQCHNNKRARADNHPVNVYPSANKNIELDVKFPLYKGKVTCVTCHDLQCLGGNETPKFLRGGPFETRVDACLVCHTREKYQAVNPHEQIDEHGRLRKDRCQYCHIIEPASKN